MDITSAIREASVRLEAQDIDAFEVTGFSEGVLVIEAKQQMVERMQRAESRGIAIRTIKDLRQGTAATTEINAKSVNQAVQSALAAMKKVSQSEDALLPKPQKSGGLIDEDTGRPIAEINDNEKTSLALTLESEALASDNRISRVQHPRYEERTTEIMVLNSHGINASARRSLCSCELKVVADAGSGAESSYEFEFSASFDRLDASALAKRAAKCALDKLGARKTQGGKMPVLFGNRAASAMARLIAPSFFADNVQRGKSMLSGFRGEPFFNPLVTIVDDGLMPNGLGSFLFDAEGTPKRRTLMVRDGVIESWLYDGPRAVRDKVESSGNSVRDGLGRLPCIGVGNCFLKAGSFSFASLMKQMNNGLYVTDLLGVHTANPISGSFSLGAEGFMIDQGVAIYPVRGFTIAGNVHDVFKKVLGIGDDLKFFGSFGAPSMLVEELMIGS